MKQTLLSLFYFIITAVTAQTQVGPTPFEQKSNTTIDLSRKIEDKNGRIITDLKEKELYLKSLQDKINTTSKNTLTAASTLPAVHLCSNSGFEEFETVSGTNVLKHYQYTTGNPLNPTQCVSVTTNANQYINQYNPANGDLMANTVPSNFIDEYIGDIQAFDQYTLKINHKNSYETSGIVQTKRFKTNNETEVKFNYKEVLQSINESGHLNEQPFLKRESSIKMVLL